MRRTSPVDLPVPTARNLWQISDNPLAALVALILGSARVPLVLRGRGSLGMYSTTFTSAAFAGYDPYPKSFYFIPSV